MTTLTHALNHHAKGIAPIVHTLCLEYTTRLVVLGWIPYNSKGGPNSWSIYKNGVERHFRAHRDNTGKIAAIRVLDAYRKGNEVDILWGRVDALRFISQLEAL